MKSLSEGACVIEAREMVVGHRGRALLPPLSASVLAGQAWVVLGRNGAGKSSLLKTLLGLLPPVSGRVLREPSMHVAFMPQRHLVDPTLPMRARDVVAMGADEGWSFLRPLRAPGGRQAVERVLTLAGCEELANERFGSLSVGQQQRVLLAQALVGQPDLVVLDEPTAGMDVVAEREALRVIDREREARGMAVVWVTHRLHDGLRRADRVCFVDADSQTAVMTAPRDLLQHPVFVSQFGRLSWDDPLPEGDPAVGSWA
ncbi:MAG: ATP-binding cassette domain-containing protein [Candidatus Sericytochromatia bacterium]|nr:ATP-binding cassette domain-containing protein [Candidatus Sericytochromatia bacterium]